MQVLVHYAGQSFRLLALAVGTLHGVSAAQLAGMDQQQAEARCGTMDLLGMLVLSNELRDNSRTTIAALQDRFVRPWCMLTTTTCVVRIRLTTTATTITV